MMWKWVFVLAVQLSTYNNFDYVRKPQLHWHRHMEIGGEIITFKEFKAAPLTVGASRALLFDRCGATISISIHAMSSVTFFCHFGTFCQGVVGWLLIFWNMHFISNIGQTPLMCHRYMLAFWNRPVLKWCFIPFHLPTLPRAVAVFLPSLHCIPHNEIRYIRKPPTYFCYCFGMNANYCF